LSIEVTKLKRVKQNAKKNSKKNSEEGWKEKSS